MSKTKTKVLNTNEKLFQAARDSIKSQHYSSLLSDKLINSIPLNIRLHVNLSMSDEENWKDGDYLGNRGSDEEIKVIIDTVKEWIWDIVNNQQSIPKQYQKIINREFWNLL